MPAPLQAPSHGQPHPLLLGLTHQRWTPTSGCFWRFHALCYPGFLFLCLYCNAEPVFSLLFPPPPSFSLLIPTGTPWGGSCRSAQLLPTSSLVSFSTEQQVAIVIQQGACPCSCKEQSPHSSCKQSIREPSSPSSCASGLQHSFTLFTAGAA